MVPAEGDTLTIGPTIYANLTEEGKQLAGKMLPMTRHKNGMPMGGYTPSKPRGISARKPETADKFNARILAAAAKGQTELHNAYIGRPDKDWILRATDGSIAVFQRDRAVSDRPELAKPIATVDRPVAFELTPELELAIKRAKVVSAPSKFVCLTIGPDFVDVSGDDFTGTSSTERVNVMTVTGETVTVSVAADLMLLFFGAPKTTIASVDPVGNDAGRVPSIAIDYAVEGWRYVIAGAVVPK